MMESALSILAVIDNCFTALVVFVIVECDRWRPVWNVQLNGSCQTEECVGGVGQNTKWSKYIFRDTPGVVDYVESEQTFPNSLFKFFFLML